MLFSVKFSFCHILTEIEFGLQILVKKSPPLEMFSNPSSDIELCPADRRDEASCRLSQWFLNAPEIR
jgi:hypothetical protein